MTKNDDRRLADQLDKHAAGQKANLPTGLKSVSDSLEEAMGQTHPRPGFINELAGQLQELRQENSERGPAAAAFPWMKRLLAGAIGAAALVAFALFVSSLFSGPPVAPMVPDRRTATPTAGATVMFPPATGTPIQSAGDLLSVPESCVPPDNRQGIDHMPYVNVSAGYCFQYPVAFTVGDVLPQGAPNAEDILAIYGPAYDPSLEPLRASLSIVVVGPADGLTLEEVVEQEIMRTVTDDEITTQVSTLGGEPAVILEGLPGRAAFRELLITIHNGKVYQLSLSPSGLDHEQVTADADGLWRAVLDSFAFLMPETLAQFAGCPTGEAPYVNLLDGYCLSYPPQFDLVQFHGTLLVNTTIPSPAGEGTSPTTLGLTISRSVVQPDYDLQSLAHDLTAQFPDAEIEREATLGPAPAIIVHNPEGLGGGRHLYAHHGDTLFRLTLFSPGGSSQATGALEQVWTAVTNSFTYLPHLPLATPVVHNDATLEPPPAIPPTRTPPSPRDFPHHQNAVLVAPADDLPVPQSEFTRLGIDVVPTFDNLQAGIQTARVEIIYLHPAVFRDLSPDALNQLYEDGRLVVILNVPVSEINAVLPVFNDYDDLAPHYFVSDEQFVAAAFQKQDDFVDASSSRWAHRDFYQVDTFWHLVHNIERQIQQLTTPLTATTTPTPPPIPFITPTPFTGDASCAAVPRPALLFGHDVGLDGLDLTLVDPFSGTQCHRRTDAYAAGALAVEGDTLYYPRRDRDAGTITVWQHALDDNPAPLSFTTTPVLSAPWFGLALSPEGQQLVWATFHEPADGARFRSQVSLGDLQAETAAMLWQEDAPDTLPPTIEPLYVSSDENLLYFARRPYGIGGTGPLPGQYSGLYMLSLEGGEPQPVFECASPFDFCLNDVDFERRLLATTSNEGQQPELRILDFDGALAARYAAPDGNFVAEPVFSPAGDVAFIAADLQESQEPAPHFQQASVRFLPASYDGEPDTLLQTTDTYLRLWRWFDSGHLLAGDWTGGQDLALLSLNGDRIPIPESGAANSIAILQE